MIQQWGCVVLRCSAALALVLAACGSDSAGTEETPSGPQPGSAGAACYPNGTCDSGLTCQVGTCIISSTPDQDAASAKLDEGSQVDSGGQADPGAGIDPGAGTDLTDACTPACGDRKCGPDGCGGDCGTCTGDQVCEDGQCEEPPPTCEDKCSSGTVECAGSGFRECTDGDGDGCAEWGSITACGGEKVCKDGLCVEPPTCSDACTLGARQCVGADSWQECVAGNEGCTVWGQATSCPGEKTCVGGECKDPACTDECTEGNAQCVGEKVQVCAAGADGCTVWGDAEACSPGSDALVCQSGECILRDTDGDGIPDFADAFPNDRTEQADYDLDGVGDNADDDDDNDGTKDAQDLVPEGDAWLEVWVHEIELHNLVDTEDEYGQIYMTVSVNGEDAGELRDGDEPWTVMIHRVRVVDATLLVDVPEDQRTHDVIVGMLDEDTFVDDRIDIDGSDDSQGISVSYDIETGELSGDTTTGAVDGRDDGLDDGPDASATIGINLVAYSRPCQTHAHCGSLDPSEACNSEQQRCIIWGERSGRACWNRDLPTQQDCDICSSSGCASGERCRDNSAEDGTATGTECVTAGSKSEGQACVESGTGSCRRGLVCVRMSESNSVCRRPCAPGSGAVRCSAGSACVAVSAAWGFCQPIQD